MVHTVDSNVLVLTMTAVQQLRNGELWLSSGSGKSFRYHPVNEMADDFGPVDVTQDHPLLAIQRELYGKIGRYLIRSPKNFAP